MDLATLGGRIRRSFLIASVLLCPNLASLAGNDSGSACEIFRQGDLLILENSRIRRTYRWNEGDIMTLSIENWGTGFVWKTEGGMSDLYLPGVKEPPSETLFSIHEAPEAPVSPFHKYIEIRYFRGAPGEADLAALSR